jgi:hypothetical protein
MTAGYKDATTERWTSGITPSCLSTSLRLYCFGVDKSAALSPAMAAGRRAFVTDTEYVPGGGVSAADSLCNSEARAAGWSQRFKALVATSTSSAASRFSSATGIVWVRPDGIAINRASTDIFKGQPLEAPLNVSASKQYVGPDGAIAGAPSLDTIGSLATTCNDWQATSAPATGLFGNVALTSESFGRVSYDCGTRARVYCLED